eukprot:2257865-Alexandrium_andersonii.AAC.1
METPTDVPRCPGRRLAHARECAGWRAATVRARATRLVASHSAPCMPVAAAKCARYLQQQPTKQQARNGPYEK